MLGSPHAALCAALLRRLNRAPACGTELNVSERRCEQYFPVGLQRAFDNEGWRAHEISRSAPLVPRLGLKCPSVHACRIRNLAMAGISREASARLGRCRPPAWYPAKSLRADEPARPGFRRGVRIVGGTRATQSGAALQDGSSSGLASCRRLCVSGLGKAPGVNASLWWDISLRRLRRAFMLHHMTGGQQQNSS